MTVTGTYNKINGTFKMHSPVFPYNSTTYIGYSLKEMKRKFRLDNGLQHLKIDWIILGLNS